MILLPIEERTKISARLPREQFECPECGGRAYRQRNGDWRCHEDIDGPWNSKILTCGAYGVTFDDGDTATISDIPKI